MQLILPVLHCVMAIFLIVQSDIYCFGTVCDCRKENLSFHHADGKITFFQYIVSFCQINLVTDH